MKAPTPEEFLFEYFKGDIPREKISRKWHNEIVIMDKFRTKILDCQDEDFNKVIRKVNMLVIACLNKNHDSIDKWLAEYGKIFAEGGIGIDWRKIIDSK